jgi:hypothetical protein
MPVVGKMVRRESRGAFGASLVAHVLFVALLVRVLLLPLPFSDFMHPFPTAAAPVEHIQFVETPVPGVAIAPLKSGGDNRPAPRKPIARLVAPLSTPAALPVAPAAPAQPVAQPAAAPATTDSGVGSGPVVGVGGPAEGARPEYHDGRVWVPPSGIVSAPKTIEEAADSALAARVRAHNDTLALGAGRRQPGDWTFEHNGKKYGIDSKFIQLGSFKIPTAVLAFLPLNVTANPIMGENERTLNARHDDIMYQAQRSLNEDEFRDAVRHVRQRLEKEHEDAAKKSSPPSPPPADKPKDSDTPPPPVQ